MADATCPARGLVALRLRGPRYLRRSRWRRTSCRPPGRLKAKHSPSWAITRGWRQHFSASRSCCNGLVGSAGELQHGLFDALTSSRACILVHDVGLDAASASACAAGGPAPPPECLVAIRAMWRLQWAVLGAGLHAGLMASWWRVQGSICIAIDGTTAAAADRSAEGVWAVGG